MKKRNGILASFAVISLTLAVAAVAGCAKPTYEISVTGGKASVTEAAEGTALYKAQNYSLNQKQALDAVLLDGRLELTNNLAERTVKPFVMARKNFLFCDTAKGADASALCFSVIETAKRNGLDPFGYLMFLLQELPKLGPDPAEEQLLPLLPWSPDLPGYYKIKQ